MTGVGLPLSVEDILRCCLEIEHTLVIKSCRYLHFKGFAHELDFAFYMNDISQKRGAFIALHPRTDYEYPWKRTEKN